MKLIDKFDLLHQYFLFVFDLHGLNETIEHWDQTTEVFFQQIRNAYENTGEEGHKRRDAQILEFRVSKAAELEQAKQKLKMKSEQAQVIYEKLLQNISPSEVHDLLNLVWNDDYSTVHVRRNALYKSVVYRKNKQQQQAYFMLFVNASKRLMGDLVKREEESTLTKAKWFSRLSYVLIVPLISKAVYDAIYGFFHDFFTRRQSLQRIHAAPKSYNISGAEKNEWADEYLRRGKDGERNRKGVEYRVQHMTPHDQTAYQWSKSLLFNNQNEFRKFLEKSGNDFYYLGTREQINRVRYRVADQYLKKYLPDQNGQRSGGRPAIAYWRYARTKSLLFSTGRQADSAISHDSFGKSAVVIDAEIVKVGSELSAARTASKVASKQSIEQVTNQLKR